MLLKIIGNLKIIKLKTMKIKRSKLKELAIEFIGNDSLEAQNQIMLKIATARCARVSYTVVGEEGKDSNYINDIKLHDRLLASKHMSPAEHCAKVMSNEEYNTHVRGKCFYQETLNAHIPIGDSLGWCRNFKGFIQYRELVS